MVKKANGKWRMCVDFTDLNKFCPKDSYHLPRIDQLVNSTAGHQLLSFMDVFLGYNQIKMDETNQEKTFFITSQGLFYYKVMPFGLKNAGATYQRLVNHMYIDNMLVKSLDEGSHLDNLQEIFETLRQYKMKLNSMLIREEEKVQKLVYYISRALRGAEGRYPLIEKLAFALITTSRKLRHYFQVHVINVMMDHPLKKAMNKLEAAGRLIQWAVEFKFTPSYEDLGEREDNKKWVIHVDGSSTLHTGGIEVVLQSLEGDKLKHNVRLQYQTTNNEVEYETLLKGLKLAKSVEADSILVLRDFQLVIGQINGTCEAKEDRMKRYLKKVVRPVKKFKEADFVQIPREENIEADTLAKEASATEARDEFDEIQYMSSIDLLEMLQIEGEENWMTPIVSYLKDGRLLEGKDEAKKLRVKLARYILMDEVLYKRSFSHPFLRCLAPDEVNYVLREVHEGACGNHSGARSLVHKNNSKDPYKGTPFKLAYGSEAVIPAKVHMASHRVMKYQNEENKEQLRLNLDLIDKVRMDTEQRIVRYKNLMAKQYDTMVKPRHFSIGDLVLKRVSLAIKNSAHGKLGPNWKGSYMVINCKRQGSYYLEALNRWKLEHPWNVEHLRRYYQ
ncbi:uncharacterized protein LOC136063751 [Quercus suber]|uniref:uncharacterized protein LOC136063751 n=1 Tax=Quercus suber TaxID=58331 RepID=UPI0032DF240B